MSVETRTHRNSNSNSSRSRSNGDSSSKRKGKQQLQSATATEEADSFALRNDKRTNAEIANKRPGNDRKKGDCKDKGSPLQGVKD
jgi:hypothetical protein